MSLTDSGSLLLLTLRENLVPPATPPGGQTGPLADDHSLALAGLRQELQGLRDIQQQQGADIARLIQGQHDLLQGQQNIITLLQHPPSPDTLAPPASTDDWDDWD